MKNKTLDYHFTGDLKPPQHPHPDAPSRPEPYVASKDLVDAVNLAIYLRRPLLLEGEAGCGKTRLAHAVAYELGLPFYRWDVRSTSKAQEGLYTYDAILRLHDVQTTKLEEARRKKSTDSPSAPRDPSNPTDYRKLGPLGKAFDLRECPAVVLIDEIDKADIDFPNDLLAVLDEPWEFTILETGEPPIKAAHKPIVIITSNKEKGNLPAPFLRRCVYFFIEFPNSEELLRQIVDAHYKEQRVPLPPDELVNTAANRFLATRHESGLFKKPGTSEFLDWLEALRRFKPAPLQADTPLPFPSLLFKLQADWKRYALAP